MNIRKLVPAALVLAAAVAAPAMAQSIATVTTTTTTMGSDVRTVTTGTPGVVVTQGVPGMTPTVISVPHARTAVFGPAQVTKSGDSLITVQQIYVDMPESVIAENNRRYLR